MAISISNYLPRIEKRSKKDHCNHEIFQDIVNGQVLCRNCGLVFETSTISFKWSVPRIYENRYERRTTQYKENQSLNRALKYEKKRSWKKRKKTIGLWELRRLISINQFGSNLFDRAFYLFEKAITLDIFKFKYVILISRVCFYYAAKIYGYSIEMKELCKDTTYSLKLFTKYYYILMQNLKLKRPNMLNSDSISKICSKLNLSENVVQKAIKIRNQFIKTFNISGYCNSGINAAAIYLASLILHERRSQKLVSYAANVSDITLRSRLKKMKSICQKSS